MDITGIGSIFDFGSKVIDKLFPDKDEAAKAKLRMLEMQQAGEFKELEAAMEIAKGQIAINAEEAKSPSLFKGGWRPGLGWLCVAGCGWNWVGLPIAMFIADLYGRKINVSPADMSEMMPILIGMLGLGGMRSLERIKGKA